MHQLFKQEHLLGVVQVSLGSVQVQVGLELLWEAMEAPGQALELVMRAELEVDLALEQVLEVAR